MQIQIYRIILGLCLLIGCKAHLVAQVDVPKTFTKPVLMHYMPWFNTPEFEGRWGWHWTMNNRNPDIVVDTVTGKREIASHFYPLIGPYASQDPDVIEYHLLLMKYAGVDAVIIDWYGVQGRNGDINSLLTNSNALIEQVDDVGLQFCLMLEDRFSDSLADAQANFAYAASQYFNQSSYLRYGAGNDPLMGIFGPITFEQPADWDSIMPYAGEDIVFLPLWYQSNEAGVHADGEYCWIYEDDTLNDYRARLDRFYRNRAPSQNVTMAIAYPGFRDFYAEGNAGANLFTIPHGNGAVLDTTLDLVTQYSADIDLLQLATWNDFGEGTMFEPTLEFGFSFLTQLQQYLGVNYGEADLRQIHRLYTLRKAFVGDTAVQAQLDRVFGHFVNLRVLDADALMDQIEGTTALGEEIASGFSLYPNPVKDVLFVKTVQPIQDLKVFDHLGREKRVLVQENQIKVSNLIPGVYWLRIGEGGNWKPFVKE